MLKTLKVITYICLLAILLGCGKSPDSPEFYYFREITISHICRIDPRYRVYEDMAQYGACWKLKLDKRGRLAYMAYIKNGRLSFNYDMRFAYMEVKYSRGRETRLITDEYGVPALKDFGIYSIVYKFDNSEIPISKSFYDDRQNLVEDSLGVAKYLFAYDPQDEHSITMLRLNARGDTITDSQGVYKNRLTLNDYGYITDSRYFDQKDHLTNSTKGVARIEYIYDNNDKLIALVFTDKEDNRAIFKDAGASVIKYAYDDNGYRKTKLYYDNSVNLTDENPIGYASLKNYYADNGLLLKTENIKADSSLSQFIDYNENGEPIELSYYDALGRYIVNDTVGYAIIRTKIHEKYIDKCFLDENEQLIEPERFGYAILRYEYDAYGYLWKIYYLGTDSQPRQSKETGYAEMFLCRDDKGNIIEIQKYDIDGHLVKD